jgi:hypothetical protein
VNTCSVCGGPMKQLFVGTYCPRDCDRPKAAEPKKFCLETMISLKRPPVPTHILITDSGSKWGMRRLQVGDTMPDIEGLRAWWLKPRALKGAFFPTMSTAETSDDELAACHRDNDKPGWDVKEDRLGQVIDPDDVKRDSYPGSVACLIFWEIP